MLPSGKYQPPKLRLKAYQRRAVRKAETEAISCRVLQQNASVVARKAWDTSRTLLEDVRKLEQTFLQWYPFFRPSGAPEISTASVTVYRSPRPDLDFIELHFRISRTVWRDHEDTAKILLLQSTVDQAVEQALL